MSYDLKLENRDIVVTEKGDIVLAKTKKELVRQWIEVAIKLMLGEWFVDTNQGTDWVNLLSERGNRLAVDMQIRSIILNVKYVEKLLEYSSFQDNATQILSANVKVQVEGGEIFTFNGIQVT